jgi:hypothetical protein
MGRYDAALKAGREIGEDILSKIIGSTDSAKLEAGSDPRYRGAAPDRSGGAYERYQPKKLPPRMERLLSSADDPRHPINGMFDGYVAKGQELNGSDWYNTEELRDWHVDRLGEAEGDARWREYIGHVGATSTGSSVPANLRNASFYNALPEDARLAVATRVAQGGITPAEAARELGVAPANMPDNYNYGHVMQSNHAKNELNQMGGLWERVVPEDLTGAARTKYTTANPKVKGFANDLLGNDRNIAADKHFMRMLAMSDGGADFLTEQAQLSMENLDKLMGHYGDALAPYVSIRKTGTGQMVTSVNLKKAAADGVVTDTAPFKGMAQAWADTPNDNEYAALEEMAGRAASRYDMTPAQFQANLWMGAGDMTGLADESQGTFMDLFRRTLDKRAGERGLDRQSMLHDFIDNRAPLAVGATGLLGAMVPGKERY